MSRHFVQVLFLLIGLCLAGPVQEREANQYPTRRPTSTYPEHGYPTSEPTSYPSTCPEPSTVTTTVTDTATETGTITTTVTDTATETATITTTITNTTPTTPPAQPTFDCPSEGYILSGDGLSMLTVDISTGQRNQLFATVGDGSRINALGYNILDNTFWASTQNSGPIIHIFSDGTTESLPGQSGNVNLGDVDINGFYWTSSLGTQWYQYNVNPLSSAYGQLVDSGTSAPPSSRVNDWVSIPVTGPFFYSLVVDSSSQATSILRWSSVTKEWEDFATYPDLVASGWNSAYGVNDGTLLGTNDDTGDIWSFPLYGGGSPFIVSTDSGSASQDAARCVLNLRP